MNSTDAFPPLSPPGPVHVIGAGLAGSEAAFFLASRGIDVVVHEMRPRKMTEAHATDRCAELVCSNSLKSLDPESAPGMLKAEMREVGSLVLDAAERSRVPGGQALAVDRDLFSGHVTSVLRAHPRIRFEAGEMPAPPEGALTIVATGPLTGESLAQWIAGATGQKDLYFYDAIAPIIDTATIDMDHAFLANRYGKAAEGDGAEEAYLNCPLTKEQYEAFIDALLAAEKVPPKNFEKEIFFQGCQPIEAIASTGRESLRFGPMKPVGLDDPKTGRRPYAVLQLRPENRSRTAYNLVGFQTRMKWGEQSKVFKLIPALARAEFFRMGSIHRNTYVCGPRVLAGDLSLRANPNVFLAGQITGVEGYLESAACGMLAAMAILARVRRAREGAFRSADGVADDGTGGAAGYAGASLPPVATALGALLRFVTASDPKHYAPMNACFAIFDPAHYDGVAGLKRDLARPAMAAQSIANFKTWWRAGAAAESERA